MQPTTQPSVRSAQHAITAFLSMVLGFKARVVWGARPHCDQDLTIHLPRPKQGDADEISLLTRMGLHEAGHVMDSDLPAYAHCQLEAQVYANAMEDARIERLMADRFVGGELVLSRGFDAIIAQCGEKADPANPHHKEPLIELSLLLRSLQALMRHKGHSLGSHTLIARANAALDPAEISALGDAVAALRQCANTGEVVKLAEGLWSALHPQDPQSHQSPDEQQPQGDQQPGKQEDAASEHGQSDPKPALSEDDHQPSDGQGATKAEADTGRAVDQTMDAGEQGAQATESEQSQGDAQSGVGISHAGPEPASSAGNPMLEPASGLQAQSIAAYEAQYGPMDVDQEPSSPESVDEAFIDKMAKALKEAEQNDADLESILEAIEGSEADHQTDSRTAYGAGSGGASDAVLNIELTFDHIAARLVRVFLRAMQDKRKRPSKIDDRGRKVLSDRLWRLKRLGDTRVFMNIHKAPGVDAGVLILLDRSGSMGKMISEALQATFCLAHALERVGRVKTSIVAFPGNTDAEYLPIEVKHYAQTVWQVKDRWGQLGASGGTPLADALQRSLPALAALRVEKRMVIVISDGRPDEFNRASRVLQHARDAGIELIGLGITAKAKPIQQLIEDSILVDTQAELPEAFEEHFRNKMAEFLSN